MREPLQLLLLLLLLLRLLDSPVLDGPDQGETVFKREGKEGE
jgi:hypothetical protein